MKAATIEQISAGMVRDYASLAKPRTVLPHLITATAAMFVAAKGLPPSSTLLFTLLGGGLVASASNVLNCYFDCDLDRMMARTRHRPLPADRMKPYQALAFGIIISFLGLFILSRFVGLAAAVLATSALVYYVLVYTLLLKRRTYWSTVVGSGIGTIPPLIGWIAVTGRVEPTALLLSFIILLWTMPHFWALAIFRRGEYEQAGIRVIPERKAVRWIMILSLSLVLATLLLVPIAHLGLLYLAVASLLGLGFLNCAMSLRNGETINSARRLYSYSIVYLTILFVAIIVDHMVIAQSVAAIAFTGIFIAFLILAMRDRLSKNVGNYVS